MTHFALLNRMIHELVRSIIVTKWRLKVYEITNTKVFKSSWRLLDVNAIFNFSHCTYYHCIINILVILFLILTFYVNFLYQSLTIINIKLTNWCMLLYTRDQTFALHLNVLINILTIQQNIMNRRLKHYFDTFDQS